MKILTVLSFAVFALFLVCCNENKTEVTNNNETNSPSPANNQASDPGTTSPDTKKTEAETYIEAITAAANVASTALENKRVKDSTKLAGKEKMFAYQIGLPMKKTDQVFDLYKKLQEAKIRNIYVVKNPDDDYVMVQYEDKEQEDLYTNLHSFKDSLAEITSEKIAVINLNEFCSKKDLIKKEGTLRKRKEDVEIPCLVCD